MTTPKKRRREALVNVNARLPISQVRRLDAAAESRESGLATRSDLLREAVDLFLLLEGNSPENQSLIYRARLRKAAGEVA